MPSSGAAFRREREANRGANHSVKLGVRTAEPYSWLVVDLETGEVYRGMPDGKLGRPEDAAATPPPKRRRIVTLEVNTRVPSKWLFINLRGPTLLRGSPRGKLYKYSPVLSPEKLRRFR